jgi:predicted nucleic acid-binding protein
MGHNKLIIVDTDILIDAGRNVSEALNCLQQIEQRLPAAVSSVTQMELIIGCRNKNELDYPGAVYRQISYPQTK